jgi:PAS domain S-box-containing protein
MKYLTAIFSLAILLGGTYFAYLYFNGQYTLVSSDPEYASVISTQLLEYFLVAAIVASLMFSLLIYSVLTTNESARRLAYKLSKDMSFSKEQFRKFYELSPVPYLLIDSKGTIMRPNKASLRFFGKTNEEMLEINLFSLLSHPEDENKIAQYKESAVRHIPIEKKEVQVNVGDGQLRWVLISIENIATPGTGKNDGLVTLVDIHEQKELERMKTEFLSLASHQLRSPLSNIKWYIEFLLNRRREQISEEVVSYLQKMYQRNADMVDLVNTLLNLSRIEMGRIKIQKEETNITEITASVVEELTPKANEKRITLETSFSGNTVMKSDGRLIRIVLQNLLTNALRYTKEEGKVFVRILASSNKVRMEVEDTGVGIPPDEQDKIFSKLYRATNAKKIETNGNGIGLYMCKELVEGLEGSISFKSVIDEGTTFFVDLPR